MDYYSQYHPRMSGSQKNTGRWTQEEHEAFVEGLRLYGNRWREVKKLVPTRSIVQIRTHAQKYFIKKAKEQGISPSKVTIGEHIAPELEKGQGGAPPQKRPRETPPPYPQTKRPKSKQLTGRNGDDSLYVGEEGRYSVEGSEPVNYPYEEPHLHELPGLPVARDSKSLGEPHNIPDITLRHVYLEPVSRGDSIGISLRSDNSTYVKVDALPRVQVSADSSAHGSQITGQQGGMKQENGREHEGEDQCVPGVAERSGAVNKGDYLVGICGVSTADIPPRSVGKMISAVRNATSKGAIVIHLSEREVSEAAFPMAVQHMRDAATALFGQKWYEDVSVAAQRARSEALQENALKAHSMQAFQTAASGTGAGRLTQGNMVR
eukprot:gb/GECG01005348.1/.p1 GENE.gb/GECG01005348.1/~~gb/GECG01005348.1/.p1  ORF type:complete len:377 (+),score=53.34 gb/GECG01005348.1/:1-1131(+)